MLENVEEFKTWGPLNRWHHPIKSKQGKTFERFVQQFQDLGYEVDSRELVAADYGASTTRKRFFMIARCDGKSIVWPEPTHGPVDSEEVRAAEDSIIVVREKANEDRFFVKYDSEKILLESHSRVRDATSEADNFYDIGKYETVPEQSLADQHERLLPETVPSEREESGGKEEEPNETSVKDDQKETNASQVEYFYDLFSQFKEDE